MCLETGLVFTVGLVQHAQAAEGLQFEQAGQSSGSWAGGGGMLLCCSGWRTEGGRLGNFPRGIQGVCD